MKILTVHGSPDPDGNSAALLSACIAGMKEINDVAIESISIYDYEIAPVWKDYFGDVMKKQTDKAKDDMPALKKNMLAADIVVLASPIYWYQLSGKMKLFVDRWTDFLNPDWTTEVKGKGLALLTTHSGINLMNSSNLLQLCMHGTADFLGMVWMGGVAGRARMPWDWDDEASLAEAKALGRKLAEGRNLIGQEVL